MSDRPAYQQRVVDEATELSGRVERLFDFLANPSVMLHPDERERMYRQLTAMQLYLSILNERISAFKTESTP